MILDNALDRIPGTQRRTGPTSCKVCCVSHDEQRPSLHLTERDGTLLFRCHAGCDQSSVADALRDLNVDFGTQQTIAPKPDAGYTSEQFVAWHDKCRAALLSGKGGGLDYLASRGITEDEAFAYGLGFGVRDCFQPFVGLAGRVTITIGTRGAEGRTINDDIGPKWKTMKGTSKLGWWAGESGPVVIVEGAFDAIAVARIGGTGVAVRGLTFSEQDLGRLKMRNPETIYLCPDADQRGDATKMLPWVEAAKRVTESVVLVRGNRDGDLGDLLTWSEFDFALGMSRAMEGAAL